MSPSISRTQAGNQTNDRSTPPTTLRKASLFVYALLLTSVVVWKFFDIQSSYHSSGKVVSIELTRGPYEILRFPSKTAETRAIILFASGDGGWSGFEEEISMALQRHGYEVIGIDSDKYASTDYNLAILQADFAKVAEKVEEPFGAYPPPLVIGGWSMGAEQAIAVGGGPNPPRRLSGLLVLDPCSRGRYGVRLSDQVDLLPTGPGTFSMDEFSGTMGHLRVAQWHAEQDSIDSRQWLETLTAPHREFDFAATGHYYSRDREVFLERLTESVSWILRPAPASGAVIEIGGKP